MINSDREKYTSTGEVDGIIPLVELVGGLLELYS